MIHPRSGAGTPPRHPQWRRGLLLSFWLLAGVAIVGRAGQLQLLEGSEWRDEAARQHRQSVGVPASRGSILDRSGVPLAQSHETFRVSVAPHEVSDPEGAAALLEAATGLPPRDIRRALSSGRRWVVLPGRYPPAAREALSGASGIHLEKEMRRFHPHGEMVAGVLGSLMDGVGAGGIEQVFDSVLAGLPGEEILARDARGRPVPGESSVLRAPRPGGEVTLTLDVEIQEIAQEALRSALQSTRAKGGDVLVTDPHTGEILAMASVRNGRPAGLAALNTPYEPGSTLKPFTVASLLENRVASLRDSIDTGNGTLRVHGRTISDVKKIGRTDLAQALQASSNVAIVRAAEVLTPAQQYETLRDFGFGTPPGLPIPGEAGGRLRRPAEWSRQSPASLAIGYEVSVTPVQMAMAYGALANGGVLMEPRLVRDVRMPNGERGAASPPRAVRRVVSERVARELREVLVASVDDGTGGAARMTTFAVAGKSGTSRAYSPSGGYAQGEYFSSFVGFFPAEDPQLVVFVKLDSPEGAYYGGSVAAPVTRETLEGILAARGAPINRGALAALARREPPRPAPGEGLARVSTAPSAVRPAALGLPAVAEASSPAPLEITLQREGARPVPEVGGLAARTAARRLHTQGFRVLLRGGGEVIGTRPEAGTLLLPGDTVRLLTAGGRR